MCGRDAWKICMKETRGRDTWKRNVKETRGREAWKRRVEEKCEWDTWKRSAKDMRRREEQKWEREGKKRRLLSVFMVGRELKSFIVAEQQYVDQAYIQSQTRLTFNHRVVDYYCNISVKNMHAGAHVNAYLHVICTVQFNFNKVKSSGTSFKHFYYTPASVTISKAAQQLKFSRSLKCFKIIKVMEYSRGCMAESKSWDNIRVLFREIIDTTIRFSFGGNKDMSYTPQWLQQGERNPSAISNVNMAS